MFRRTIRLISKRGAKISGETLLTNDLPKIRKGKRRKQATRKAFRGTKFYCTSK